MYAFWFNTCASDVDVTIPQASATRSKRLQRRKRTLLVIAVEPLAPALHVGPVMPVIELALVRDYRRKLIPIHFAREDALLPASGRDTSEMAAVKSVSETYSLSESCMYGRISSSVGNVTIVSTLDRLLEFCSNRCQPERQQLSHTGRRKTHLELNRQRRRKLLE
jgi:hypothetical protein